MPTQGKRNPEATREAILEAAAGLFIKHGYAATAMSAVAKKAGVTKSLIHHYFGSKEALWQEVTASRMREVWQYVSNEIAIEGRSLEKMREAVRVVFGFFRENRDLLRLLAWLHAENDDNNLEPRNDLMQRIVGSYQRAQERKILREDIQPRYFLLVMWTLVEQWFIAKKYFSHRLDEELDAPEIDDAYLDAVIKIFFEGASHR